MCKKSNRLYRIGIIGPGRHFIRKIFPILKNHKSFKVSGILRNKKKKFEKIKLLKEKEFFNSDFDFVYIATPNETHEKYIIKSLQSNFHVICEKPFLLKKRNLLKIIKLSQSKKKLIFECFMYKYHPLFKEIEKIINQEKLGKLKYIISNWKYPFLEKKNNRYQKESGNGFWYDSASYLISLDNYFFKEKKDIEINKIKKNLSLRGNIIFKSQGINRYYFWGEGQSYKNDIELFFTKGTVYAEQFYAKKDTDKIKLKVFQNFKIYEKKIENRDHFSLMFNDILKNFNKKKYQKLQRENIYNQTIFLSKSS